MQASGRPTWPALTGTFWLVMTGSTPAHHSFVSHYDASRTMELSGVVAEFRMRSPHSFLVLDVQDEQGTVKRWEVETHSVPGLRRAGIDRDTFEPGDAVTVIAWPNRHPDRTLIFGRVFITADGRRLGETKRPEAAEIDVGKVTGVARLNGRWMTPPPGPAEETPLPLTDAGLRQREKFDPQLSPANACVPATIPSIFYAPYLYDIRIDAGKIVLKHEVFNVTRDVKLDAPPARVEPSGWFGLVTARLEGDELVIESTAYPPSGWGLAIAAGRNGAGRDVPSSPEKKTTERYSVSDDGKTLRVDYTLEDPVYLREPFSSHVELSRVADNTTMHPFDCEIGSASRFSAER